MAILSEGHEHLCRTFMHSGFGNIRALLPSRAKSEGLGTANGPQFPLKNPWTVGSRPVPCSSPHGQIYLDSGSEPAR